MIRTFRFRPKGWGGKACYVCMYGLVEGVWSKECMYVVGEDLMTKEIGVWSWFKQRLVVLLVPC